MENKIKLEISQYSMNPGPRYISQGDDSGEDFYHKCLNKKYQEALANNDRLIVDLDGTNGYASSFLDEAFGNLVYDFGLDSVKQNIILISREEPEWIDMINNETFSEWEIRRKSKQAPRKTSDHEPWYVLSNSQITLNNGYRV